MVKASVALWSRIPVHAHPVKCIKYYFNDEKIEQRNVHLDGTLHITHWRACYGLSNTGISHENGTCYNAIR